MHVLGSYLGGEELILERGKRHNPSCNSTTCRGKHLNNGLTFMPVQCTGLCFSFLPRKRGMFSTMICHKEPHRDIFDGFQFKIN